MGRPRVWLKLWPVEAVLANRALGLLLADTDETATHVGLALVKEAYVAGGEGSSCLSLGMHRGWVCLLGTSLL